MIDKVFYAKMVFPLEETENVALASEGMHILDLEELSSPALELMQNVLSVLKQYKGKRNCEELNPVSDIKNEKIKEICESVPERETKLNNLLSEGADLKSQIRDLKIWKPLLKYVRLRDDGYFVKFCLVTKKIPADFPYAFHRIKKCAAIISKNTIELPDDLIEFSIRGELEQYKEEAKICENELNALKAKMAKNAKFIPALKEAEKLMKYNLNLQAFEKVVKVEEKFGNVEVFFPSSEKEKYLASLNGHAGLYIRNPIEEDNVPILLNNSKEDVSEESIIGSIRSGWIWLASLFEILTKQGSVPKYGVDVDPTPLLMIPFWLYFGLCMPDIGYSMLILGGVFFAVRTLKKRKIIISGNSQKLISLVIVLGISSLIVGVLASSLFGFALPVPQALLTTNNIMGIGMWMGVGQLTFGLLVKIFISWKGKTEWKIGADVGWLMVYLAAVLWFVGSEADYGRLFKYGFISAVIIEGFEPYKEERSISGLLKYIGSWFGTSLWNTFNRGSGLFSDTISFVRIPVLFLVAIVLGNVVVALGKSMGIFGVFVIIFGNLFVFMLSILGAVAHPARLQLIEFRHQFETGNENASFYKAFNR